MYHVRSECTKHGMFFQNKSSAFKAYHVAEEQQHQQINYGFLSSPLWENTRYAQARLRRSITQDIQINTIHYSTQMCTAIYFFQLKTENQK